MKMEDFLIFVLVIVCLTLVVIGCATVIGAFEGSIITIKPNWECTHSEIIGVQPKRFEECQQYTRKPNN